MLSLAGKPVWHLILLDPTILLHDLGDALQGAVRANMAERIPMVESALHRIHTFASVDAAEHHLRSKRVFSQWDEHALRKYAEYGTVPTSANEGRRELRFSPAWEAYYYASYTPLYDLLPQLDGLLPTLFIEAEDSNAFVPKTLRKSRTSSPARPTSSSKTRSTCSRWSSRTPSARSSEISWIICSRNWVS